MSDDTSSNLLGGETSPYLLQHANNPVHWHPWGPAALDRAKRQNRPIFLSIGYAACHWCHVMERESFEDPAIARLLNEHFVPIKVDREERPDLDEIYMSAVQLMIGQGGWPLNVFLTPELRPFIGGTYFPPDDRHGRPGLTSILTRIHRDWTARRDEIDRWADEMTGRLQEIAGGGVAGADGDRVGQEEIAQAVEELGQRFDSRRGGFGGAPKFPPDGALALLLRATAGNRDDAPAGMVEKTLDAMALGGMYDHAGGGFARYSVDEQWLVPHFEKMLYNQALLVPVYLDAWRVTARPLYRRVVEQTLDFVYRELTDDGGGFLSSLDADSDGVEGKFYVWTPAEVEAALGRDDGRFFCETYGITEGGNFEGGSILNLLGGSLAEVAARLETTEADVVARLEPMLGKLLESRAERTRPATDDKVLTAWNGLMIGACARAYQVFEREVDLQAAVRAADFVLERLTDGDRLRVSYRAGRAALNGYLDDYAFLARGLVDLYEAGFDPRYLEAARDLAATLVARFEDRDHGGFHFVSDDHETLLARTHSLHDGALPSGAGVATEVLLRLAVHFDDPALRAPAERALAACRPAVRRMPSAFASLLAAADAAEGAMPEIVIAGPPEVPETRALLRAANAPYLPDRVVQVGESGRLPLLVGKQALDGRPTAYVCRNRSCDRPTTSPDELEAQVRGLRRVSGRRARRGPVG